ncbi:hypothetical protein KOW79_011064 [Hemibagrus wyckioides]|uniref:Uncharacterized protein n=1 Tax=Hemibagrus wyckioides TaxID=337641 RepID=A0A9D3NP22_9TELE|nr:hypothetical protein KOW79_011064 [Hemibagrus wyckioides]
MLKCLCGTHTHKMSSQERQEGDLPVDSLEKKKKKKKSCKSLKKVKVKVRQSSTAAQGILEIIDNYDREGTTFADGLYAETKTYANAFKNEPGKRIPKAGFKAKVGVGRAGAEWRIISVAANGPNASVEAEAMGLEAGAMAQAEIASVSAVAGPIEAKLGLGIDTGSTRNYSHNLQLLPQLTFRMSSKGHVRVISKPKKKKLAKIRRATAAQGIFEIIDNFDREATVYADGLYADADTYASAFENAPGKRIPKAGAKAEVGFGRAVAQWSVFGVEANGPNASAEASANGLEAGAMAVAELGSVSAVAGPIEARLGLAIDTGIPEDITGETAVFPEGFSSWISDQKSKMKVEASGPNATVEAGLKGMQVGAMAVAELASVSAEVGPVEAKLGLGVDTGTGLDINDAVAPPRDTQLNYQIPEDITGETAG